MPFAKAALRLLISIALLGAIVWALDGADLWCRLASADFRWFAAAVFLGIVANVASAWRWLFISRHLDLSASARVLLPAYAHGVALNTVIPGATLGGDAYRAIALRKLGNPLLKSAASVALDRLSGLWTLLVISWLAWLALTFGGEASLAPAMLNLHLATILPAIIAPFIAGFVGTKLRPDPDSLPARFMRLLIETARLARVTFAWSAIVQVATIAALWSALHAVSPEVPIIYLTAIAAPVFIAAALPLSVGGYGTREAALAAYYTLAGLSAEVAVAGAVLHGVAVMLQGALWASLYWIKTHD